MLNPSDLYGYQTEIIKHQLTHDKSMIWVGMGLGKTVSTLTSILARQQLGQVKKVLIFAPLRVVYGVWEREARKWEHTKNLRFSIIHGSEKKRKAALFTDADIYLINYEGMNWLAETLNTYYPDKLPFEFVVYDEVTKVKNSQSKRIKGGSREVEDSTGRAQIVKSIGWKTVANKFKYRTGLTGSPASNGMMDLFGQFLMIDDGDRLGHYITHYRNAFFSKCYDGWSYKCEHENLIHSKIADIVIKMESRDYLDMPECKTTDVLVDLPPKARQHYQQIEEELFTALDSGQEVELFNKVSVSNKCLQVCNGGVYYDEFQNFEALHDAKLKALEDIIEDANGQPILLAYNFKSDAKRIEKKFKRVVNLTESKNSDTEKIIKNFNDGKINILMGHPASIGHGVDGLQDSCCIVVWFGCNWSLELYEQLNARIDRNGQTKSVSILRILCDDTIDLAVVEALEHKDTTQTNLKNAIDKYRGKK